MKKLSTFRYPFIKQVQLRSTILSIPIPFSLPDSQEKSFFPKTFPLQKSYSNSKDWNVQKIWFALFLSHINFRSSAGKIKEMIIHYKISILTIIFK